MWALIPASAIAAGVAGQPVHAMAGLDNAPGRIEVRVSGAVADPGTVILDRAQAGLRDALARAGDLHVDAYPFAALVLRRAPEALTRSPCLVPVSLHASLLLQDDPVLGAEQAAIDALLAGRLGRSLAIERTFGRLGSDRGRQAALQSGDLLAVPRRSRHVYVVLAGGGVERIDHRDEWMAADYLDAVPERDLAPRQGYVMYYPDGHVTELALSAWNRMPTAVPPGSMLVPGNACLRIAG